MKHISTDKLIEFIEKNTSWLYATKDYLNDIPQIDKEKLLSFISTNSREYPTTSANSGFLKGNCESCFYAINGEAHTGIPCNDCDKFANKWTPIYKPKADVKTTDKSCDNCGNNVGCGKCARGKLSCDKGEAWTPIKADKVEKGENK